MRPVPGNDRWLQPVRRSEFAPSLRHLVANCFSCIYCGFIAELPEPGNPMESTRRAFIELLRAFAHVAHRSPLTTAVCPPGSENRTRSISSERRRRTTQSLGFDPSLPSGTPYTRASVHHVRPMLYSRHEFRVSLPYPCRTLPGPVPDHYHRALWQTSETAP